MATIASERSQQTDDTGYGGSLRTEIINNKSSKEWDTFTSEPIKPQTGSMVERKFYEFMLKIIKLIVYGILFAINIIGNFFSMSSELFAVAQINGRSITYCNNDGDDTSNTSQLPLEARAPWYWCLILGFVVPEIISFVRTPWIYGCIGCKFPNPLFFGIIALVEILHTLGLVLLFFVILPDLDVLQATAAFSCICLIPSILGLLSSIEKETYGQLEEKSFFHSQNFDITADAVALSLQVAGIITFTYIAFLNKTALAPWLLPIALVLISVRWWNNYVSFESDFGFIRKMAGYSKKMFLTEQKDEEKADIEKKMMMGFRAIVRVTIFISGALLIAWWRGLEPDVFFDGFWIFNNHRVLINNEVLQSEVSFVIIVLLIHVVSTFSVYASAQFACRSRMEGFGFALPSQLAIPSTFFGLLLMCIIREKEPCVFSGIIPNYMFFFSPSINQTWLLEWYDWLCLPWFLSTIWITRHIWNTTCEKLATSERIFATPMYDSLLVDHSLALARWRYEPEVYDFDEEPKLSDEDGLGVKKEDTITQIYACATMWHETEEEMIGFLKSILRLDDDRAELEREYAKTGKYPRDYYKLDVHIFFDDAFVCNICNYSSCVHQENEENPPSQINDYVHDFVKAMTKCVIANDHKPVPPVKIPILYGGRLEYTLPKGTKMYVHLKDKNKIRAKKRWSQVMYMYYLLKFGISDNKELTEDRKTVKFKHTYILTLDGDIDFKPTAVKVLVDRMKVNELLGSVCGRIHPLGDGPLVWYQKFEYAVGHWLQKATEHVIGSVLCSPGCFALFRTSALIQHNVIKKYTTIPENAREFIQYDQGEDRWLCTLLLQRGFKVEYSAASDSYTHAPESFNVFFIQRRRWIPSTIANIMDLLETSHETRKRNRNISRIFIWYQKLLMVSTILGPGTIFLMLVGAFVAVFRISILKSFVINFIPVVAFCLTCFWCKEKTQLLFASVLSTIYGLVMIVVLVGAIIQISEDGWLAPTSLLFAIFLSEYVLTGLMHPLEYTSLLCGIVYYITVPAMYMLLIIFSLFNMNNISWGTREAPKPPETVTDVTKQTENINTTPAAAPNSLSKDKWTPVTDFFLNLFGRKRQTLRDNQLNELRTVVTRIETKLDNLVRYPEESYKKESSSDIRRRQSFRNSKMNLPSPSDDDDENETDLTNSDTEILVRDPNRSFTKNPDWIIVGDNKLGKGKTSFITREEETFWKEFIPKYLQPIDKDAKKEEEDKKKLLELRNQYIFKFFMINALFILTIVLMQQRKDIVYINWPLGIQHNITYRRDGSDDHMVNVSTKHLVLEPIGFLFIFGFILILFIQFVAMLFHRFETFSHTIAHVDLKNTFFRSKKGRETEEEEQYIAQHPINETHRREHSLGVDSPGGDVRYSFRVENTTSRLPNPDTTKIYGVLPKPRPNNTDELERNDDYSTIDEAKQQRIAAGLGPRSGRVNGGYVSDDEDD